MDRKAVSVIIAAYNAADTVAMAVRSALAEPETGEVIVIDDCSHDTTADTVRAVGGGDSRLVVLVQDANRGPAAARNRGIDLATMPFVAVLDSDDRFMPGRMSRLFSKRDWDFCADNIAFTPDRAIFDRMDVPVVRDPVDLDLGIHRNSTRVERRSDHRGLLPEIALRSHDAGEAHRVAVRVRTARRRDVEHAFRCHASRSSSNASNLS